MSVSVRIPTPLRKVTNGEDKADVDGNTVSAIIASLDSQFPGIKSRLCDDSGDLRSFVNIYVNAGTVIAQRRFTLMIWGVPKSIFEGLKMDATFNAICDLWAFW